MVIQTVGTRRQVWNGSAKHTSGGLTKKDLMKHKGRIVSRRAHAAGLKAIVRLRKSGKMASPFKSKGQKTKKSKKNHRGGSFW